ncbi:unnamed protein product [Ilex paraguariensis]|uniref:Uncharacterized protein n=1 Tax=Ilex paraguariensis TaxID=185542 RepID=A0ABC8UWJ0_9AQUA
MPATGRVLLLQDQSRLPNARIRMPAVSRHDLQQMVREHAAKCKDEGVRSELQAVIWDQSMWLFCFGDWRVLSDWTADWRLLLGCVVEK